MSLTLAFPSVEKKQPLIPHKIRKGVIRIILHEHLRARIYKVGPLIVINGVGITIMNGRK